MSAAAAGTAGVAAAGGGAGPAPAAPAAAPAAAAAAPSAASAAAAAASGAPAGSVFVKRAGDPHARFALVDIFADDTVGHLAERASLKRGWAVDAAFVDLFVVRDSFAEAVENGDESSVVAAKRLFSGASLARAGVSNGAFLLARLTAAPASAPAAVPAAAPGECARARGSQSSLSLARRAVGCQRGSRVVQGGDSAGVFAYGALTLSVPSSLHRSFAGGGGSNAAAAAGGGDGGGGRSVDVAAAFLACVESHNATCKASSELPPLNSADVERFLSESRFTADVAKLARGQALPTRDLSRIVLTLVRTVSSTTARRFSSQSTFVLDGSVPDARGQPGVAIHYAFRGSRAYCAKVGSLAPLAREFRASAAVHGAFFAPTVVHAVALENVTRRANVEPYAALMMPLYSMTVGAASLAMDAGVGSALDVFALNVALCALAAVKAFNLAGLAHGDIKPSNLLVGGDGSGLVVLCDLGTACECGESFAESSAFSLNLVRVASLRYDVVSLGATLASLLSVRINVGHCADVAALRGAIDGLSRTELSSPLWRFVDACLGFADDGASAELELLRALLARIAEEVRPKVGLLATAILSERDVWPRARD